MQYVVIGYSKNVDPKHNVCLRLYTLKKYLQRREPVGPAFPKADPASPPDTLERAKTLFNKDYFSVWSGVVCCSGRDIPSVEGITISC